MEKKETMKSFHKYLSAFLLIMMISFLSSGCGQINSPGVDSSDKVHPSDKVNYSNEIDKNLKNMSAVFSKSIDGTDFYDTLKPYLNKENPEFLVEFARRMKDIKQLGVSEIKFTIVDIDSKFISEENNIIRVKIRENYKIDSSSKTLSYWADFLILEGRAYFNDLAFSELTDSNITLYYDKELEPISGKILQSIKTAYEKVGETLPGRVERTIIKAYSDNGIFSSFIKPSIGFDMIGWNEAGESVKINFGHINWKALGDPALKKILDSILVHEITHLVSGEMSGNNMPYWFAEGLATYVDETPADGLPSVTLDDLAGENIENITDAKIIRQFYLDSEIYIKAFYEKKGRDEMIRIINLMGEYPANIEDAGSSIEDCNRIFDEIVRKEYGVDTRNFGEMLIK